MLPHRVNVFSLISLLRVDNLTGVLSVYLWLVSLITCIRLLVWSCLWFFFKLHASIRISAEFIVMLITHNLTCIITLCCCMLAICIFCVYASIHEVLMIHNIRMSWYQIHVKAKANWLLAIHGHFIHHCMMCTHFLHLHASVLVPVSEIQSVIVAGFWKNDVWLMSVAVYVGLYSAMISC